MKSYRLAAVLLALVGGMSSQLWGLTYQGVGVDYWAGSGSNEATIAVDFDLDESFLFGYRWDPCDPCTSFVTGWDALSAIDNAGALDVTSIYWPGWGMAVDDLAYPGGDKFVYGTNESTGWGYYGSSDGATWALQDGASLRLLNDGDWDCWVWTSFDLTSWPPLMRAPGEEPVAVPEPSVVGLFLLGTATLRMRRWGRLR